MKGSNTKELTIRREWAMPNKHTFDIPPIKKLVLAVMNENGNRANEIWIDPFANKSTLADITNDLNPEYDTQYHLDALDFLQQFEDNSVDGVLYDPPYCYDRFTEVYTLLGWKYIKDVKVYDFVMTLDTHTGEMYWQTVWETVEKHYQGKAYQIQNDMVDLVITSNHNCVTYTKPNRKDVFGKGGKRREGVEQFRLQSIDSISESGKQVYFIGMSEENVEQMDTGICSHLQKVNWQAAGGYVVPIKQEHIKEVIFGGVVYCLCVQNQTLLVRRNGKVCISGNSPRQISECYKGVGIEVTEKTTQNSFWAKHKREISRILKVGGRVIVCSWNSGGIGLKYGFEKKEILLVNHGSWHNDTIVVVEEKVRNVKQTEDTSRTTKEPQKEL